MKGPAKEVEARLSESAPVRTTTLSTSQDAARSEIDRGRTQPPRRSQWSTMSLAPSLPAALSNSPLPWRISRNKPSTLSTSSSRPTAALCESSASSACQAATGPSSSAAVELAGSGPVVEVEASSAAGRLAKIEPSESCRAWREPAAEALIRELEGRPQLLVARHVDEDAERAMRGEGCEADAAEASSRRAGREDGRPMAFISSDFEAGAANLDGTAEVEQRSLVADWAEQNVRLC